MDSCGWPSGGGTVKVRSETGKRTSISIHLPRAEHPWFGRGWRGGRVPSQAAHPSPLAECALRRQTPEVVPELGSLGSVRGALSNERPLYVAA
jgi:hypothetical protein